MIKSIIIFALIIFAIDAQNIQNQELLNQLKIKSLDKPIVVLTCSDYQILINKIFSQTFKNVYVIRNIGDIVDLTALASIEFALDYLNTELVIIMGHQSCLAVQGALDVTFQGAKAHPKSLNEIFRYIQPSFGAIESSEEIKKAIIDNTIYQKNYLIAHSKITQNKIRKNKLHCIALYYDIDSELLTELTN
jgi:carbonic anhydrase